MSQKEVLHLLPAEVDLVLVIAFDCLSLLYGIIQGQQELFKALHYGRRWTQIHVMDVTEPNGKETKVGWSFWQINKNHIVIVLNVCSLSCLSLFSILPSVKFTSLHNLYSLR